MTTPARNERATEPVLTPTVIRRLCRRSQLQVAAAAGTSIGSVRLYEANMSSIHDPEIRRSLSRVYSELKTELLTRPQPPQ